MDVVQAGVSGTWMRDARYRSRWRWVGAGVAAMLGLGSAALAALCAVRFGAPSGGAPQGLGASMGLALAVGTLVGSLSGLGLLLAACAARLRRTRPAPGPRTPSLPAPPTQPMTSLATTPSVSPAGGTSSRLFRTMEDR